MLKAEKEYDATSGSNLVATANATSYDTARIVSASSTANSLSTINKEQSSIASSYFVATDNTASQGIASATSVIVKVSKAPSSPNSSTKKAARLKELMFFIGRVNGLLKTRNQEVSLAFVYNMLKCMQAQGYFQQLNVRWNYDLNFTGHAFLKLEYEAEGNVVLVLNSLGLGSIDGPLPLEMTQMLHQLKRGSNAFGVVGVNGLMDSHSLRADRHDLTEKKQGIVAFLDLLSSRLFELYEHALTHGSIASMLMQGSYPVLPLLWALIGAGTPVRPKLEQRAEFASASTVNTASAALDRHYALSYDVLNAAFPLLIGAQQGSLEALRLLLNKLLHVPVTIVPFEFAMYAIPQSLLSRFNKRRCVLGGNIRLGSHYASFNRKFTLILGPIDFSQFQALKLNHAEANDCTSINDGSNRIVTSFQILCTLALKRPLDFSVVYLLNTKSIPRLCLGHKHAEQASQQAVSSNDTDLAELAAFADAAAVTAADSQVSLGRGTLLRNYHTVAVVGLVRQHYHAGKAGR